MLQKKKLNCGSHFDGGKSQRRENDATTFKPGSGDARSEKVVFKLASLNELDPYDDLNVAVKLNDPNRCESDF